MFRKLSLLVVALAVPGTAGAVEWGKAPTAAFDVFAVPRMVQKLGEVPAPLDDLRLYGDGAGFRGTVRVYDWLGVIAEYQNSAAKAVTLGPNSDEAGGTLQEYRFGAGWLHFSGSGVFLEYRNSHSTGYTEDGYGIRGRAAFRPIEPVHAYAELGFAGLTGSDDVKVDALHFALGGAVPISGPWHLFTEYRRTRETNDVDDSIFTQEDFRLGVRANLDY